MSYSSSSVTSDQVSATTPVCCTKPRQVIQSSAWTCLECVRSKKLLSSVDEGAICENCAINCHRNLGHTIAPLYGGVVMNLFCDCTMTGNEIATTISALPQQGYISDCKNPYFE